MTVSKDDEGTLGQEERERTAVDIERLRASKDFSGKLADLRRGTRFRAMAEGAQPADFGLEEKPRRKSEALKLIFHISHLYLVMLDVVR